MFDYKLIEAYATVIKEGGFDKAARKLFITQSAVSQRVKQLEEQFGQIVLQRSTPPKSTEFGKKIMRLYNQVSRLEDDLHNSSKGVGENGFTSLPIGINADTLATWFLESIQPFLKKNKVVLDIKVDDQEETQRFLRDGEVLGCVSTRKTALQGCNAYYLGDIEYGLFCSPEFREKWFSEGITLAAVQRAPMITFNRKDELNTKIIKRLFGCLPDKYATFYVPSTEMFLAFINAGLAFGAMPEQQSRQPLQAGLICELVPAHREEVSLYWHCWNLESELLHGFSEQIIRGFKKKHVQYLR